MLATLLHPLEREYQTFRYRGWNPSDCWSSLDGADPNAQTSARYYFWELAEDDIRATLSLYSRAGWEPQHPIGPALIKLRKTVTIENGIRADDLLLGFITCGISLFQQLMMYTPRCYVTYHPIELRVRLQRINV